MSVISFENIKYFKPLDNTTFSDTSQTIYRIPLKCLDNALAKIDYTKISQFSNIYYYYFYLNYDFSKLASLET